MTQALAQRHRLCAAAGSQAVTVIGAGNIGSQLLGHLARQSSVGKILIVDPDTYSESNLSCQNISREDVGQPKAVVAARRALRARREGQLEVVSIVDRVENMPLGTLRANVLCGCVDSRTARGEINRIAHRLSIPWVDAGIQGDGWLARVNVYQPSADTPCLECAWSTRDYEFLAQSYACDGGLKPTEPTNASSTLGGLAAAMAGIECQKLLDGATDQSLAGRQWIIEARHHQQYVNVLRRNASCLFDHQVWDIEPITSPVHTVGDLASHGRRLLGGEQPLAIGVECSSWVTRLRCPRCGNEVRTVLLQRRASPLSQRCTTCDVQMQPMGFSLPQLRQDRAASRLLDRPLAKLGLRAGDVVTITGGSAIRHLELVKLPPVEGD